MKRLKTLLPATLFALSSLCEASPSIIETDYAKIVVIRPAEQWTPKTNINDVYQAGFEAKRFRLVVFDKNDERKDARSSDIPKWLERSLKKLSDADWITNFRPGNPNYIWPEKTVSGSEFMKINSQQAQNYIDLTIKSGNPEKLISAQDKSKFLSNLLTAATTVIGLKIGGFSGGQAVSGGLSENIGSIPQSFLSKISNNWPTDIDFSNFKEIDIRKIGSDQIKSTSGQIIIAYKKEKTPEIAEDAMVEAIYTLVGVDTNLEIIEQSRREDFQRRLSIWNECVAQGKCQE